MLSKTKLEFKLKQQSIIDIEFDKNVKAFIVRHVNNKIELFIDEVKALTLTFANNIERDIFIIHFRSTLQQYPLLKEQIL